LNDSDTFWHIPIGNWILQSYRLPTVDQFSYTAFSKPCFAGDWLSDLVFAVLYSAGQWRAVTEIAAVTCGVISGLLSFYFAKKLGLSVALGLTVIIAPSLVLTYSPGRLSSLT
jgi:hypothetical protein